MIYRLSTIILMFSIICCSGDKIRNERINYNTLEKQTIRIDKVLSILVNDSLFKLKPEDVKHYFAEIINFSVYNPQQPNVKSKKRTNIFNYSGNDSLNNPFSSAYFEICKKKDILGVCWTLEVSFNELNNNQLDSLINGINRKLDQKGEKIVLDEETSYSWDLTEAWQLSKKFSLNVTYSTEKPELTIFCSERFD